MKKKCLTVKHLTLEKYNILNEEFYLECSSIYQIINENEKGAFLFKALLDLIDSKKKCFFYDKPLKDNFEFIGYYSPDFSLDLTFKIKDFFSYSASFYKNNYDLNLKRLLNKFNIDLNKKIVDLEKDEIELIKLIECIYHKPNLLFLNDPYKFLNIKYIYLINEELISLKENNSTIFINSSNVSLEKSNFNGFFCYVEPRFSNVCNLKAKSYILEIETNIELNIKKLIHLKDNLYKYTGELKNLIDQLDFANAKINHIFEDNHDSIL